MHSFQELDLDPKILKNLDTIGYQTPTPIQQQAIPIAMQGKDLIASAQTGTGKTCAFLIPAIERLIKEGKPKGIGPRVLILVPTRELAQQVEKEAKIQTKMHPHLVTISIYGGVPYPMQRKNLAQKHDILVATPGRLIDHMQQGKVNLSHVLIAILDEADRMLDMGFVDPVKDILSKTPKSRQTLLFSATLDKKVLNLSKEFQNNPQQVLIETTPVHEGQIEKIFYKAQDMRDKEQILDSILSETKRDQTLIFTATKRLADQLANSLREKGHKTGSLHGDLSQRERTRTIQRLREGKLQILVATDVASRGIDIPAISHVINFDLPAQTEDFIHRIGRTGRAGAKGCAISFATHRERGILLQLERHFGTKLTLANGEMTGEKRPKKRFQPSGRRRFFSKKS
jgi:superfamily II DNA/RNA helicase